MSTPLSGSLPEPAPEPSSPAVRPEEKRPWGVWFIVVVLACESAMLLIVGVLALLSLIAGDRQGAASGTSLASGIFLVFLCLLFAGGLAAVAAQLAKGFRWTRAAVFVWQLLMVTLIVPAILNGYWLATLVIVPPLMVLILLFSPRVVAYTLRQAQSPAL